MWEGALTLTNQEKYFSSIKAGFLLFLYKAWECSPNNETY